MIVSVVIYRPDGMSETYCIGSEYEGNKLISIESAFLMESPTVILNFEIGHISLVGFPYALSTIDQEETK